MSEYTEVTTRSWFSRIKDSFAGILFGLALFIAAFPLIFWNEGNAVKVANSLNEGASTVISLNEINNLEPSNEGKLVHLNGMITNVDILSDEAFGIELEAVKLKRKVEVYQWQENSKKKKEKKLGGSETTTTTYTYEKIWSEDLINSSEFNQSQKHVNPTSKAFESESQVSSKGNLGAYELSSPLINQVNTFEPIAINLPSESLMDKYADRAQIVNGQLFVGSDPSNPEIGDFRISFEVANPLEVSVIAKQMGSSLRPYKTSNGRTLEMLSVGNLTAEEMFNNAQAANTLWTWIFRAIAFLMMLIGLSSIFKPLSVLASVVPFIGSLVGMGTGLVAFVLTLAVYLVTVALAWFSARPILSISLIVVAALAIMLFKRYGPKSTKK